MRLTKSNLTHSISDDVTFRIINELYKAGQDKKDIGRLLGLSVYKVHEFIPNLPDVSTYPKDEKLVNKILYDFDMPLATDVIIENEKNRYAEYSKLEKTSLRIMNAFLEYYEPHLGNGNLKQDKEIAKMASEFIKVTQEARKELMQKYAVDKLAENENNDKLIVEFI